MFILLYGKVDDTTVGFFRIGEKNLPQRVGFTYCSSSSRENVEYYNLHENGELQRVSAPSAGVAYLPLIRTTFKEEIGNINSEVWEPNDDSPYRVLGLNIPDRRYPLFLFDNTTSTSARFLCYYGKRVNTPYLKLTESRLMEMKTMWKSYPEPEKVKFPLVIEENYSEVKEGEDKSFSWEDPKSIVKYLDEHVIGQDEAKITVAVAFSNYMLRCDRRDEEIVKENLLLLGPSGVGKTYMVSLLARKASLPFIQAKITGKSGEGYVGENLSSVFDSFRQQTQGEFPYGVVFFDELDKAVKDNGENSHSTKMLDSLIGWLEEASLQGPRHGDQNRGAWEIHLNTRNILFVTAGAFLDPEESLQKVIAKRIGANQRVIGFGRDSSADSEKYELLHKVTPEDLIAYGMKPELVGRLPMIAVFNALSTEDKIKILKESKGSSLKKYVRLMELRGYTIEYDDSLLEEIVQRCPEETGARALHSICGKLFKSIIFDPEKYASGKIIRITSEIIQEIIPHDSYLSY